MNFGTIQNLFKQLLRVLISVLLIVSKCVIKYHKLKHIVIMNKEQTKALVLYCDMTFGHRDIPITKCIDRLDADAKDAGMSRLQFLDYIDANSRLAKVMAGIIRLVIISARL